MTPGRRRRWTVVLPLKGGPAAKSRLGGPPALARAFALDTLDAVLATPSVRRALVVTADPPTAAEVRALGADVVAEQRPGGGLVSAVRDGLAAARGGGPTAVLLGDLPAVTAADLTTALDACATALSSAAPTALTPAPAAPRSVLVADADGTGTVLLAASRPDDVDPAFGPGSAAEHARRGAVRLDLDLPRLRRDVDTGADLDAVLALGAGLRTRALIHAAVAAESAWR